MKNIPIKKLSAKKYILLSSVILIGILLDQISKILTVKYIPLYHKIPVVGKLFGLTYITNDGAAWGMLDDHRWVFMLTSTVAILVMLGYLYLGFSQSALYEISLAIIISGGIGNMIDRIAYGEVVDMLELTFIEFPVFNVADSFVCIGAGLLILAMVLDIIKEAKKGNGNASDSN
ncbi:MAG: signal peptidase II [Clostridia bacterium]|nr:signal peptidase II [Clostridia bacterium]